MVVVVVVLVVVEHSQPSKDAQQPDRTVAIVAGILLVPECTLAAVGVAEPQSELQCMAVAIVVGILLVLERILAVGVAAVADAAAAAVVVVLAVDSHSRNLAVDSWDCWTCLVLDTGKSETRVKSWQVKFLLKK